MSIPEGQDEDFEVMVDIVDDTVNEAEEGFFLVIEQEGLPPATKLERCITLVIIPDNDCELDHKLLSYISFIFSLTCSTDYWV